MKNAVILTTYQYTPLQLGEIRLLVLYPGDDEQRLSCHLEQVSVSSIAQYETISYAWGDVNDTDWILCDDRQIKITRSLHSGSFRLRHSVEERVLCADAMCINQEDVLERSAQVTLVRVRIV